MEHGGPDSYPGIIGSYLNGSGLCPGPLIAWWFSHQLECYAVVTRQGRYAFDVAFFKRNVGHWGHDLNGVIVTFAEARAALEQRFFDAPPQVLSRIHEFLEKQAQEEKATEIKPQS